MNGSSYPKLSQLLALVFVGLSGQADPLDNWVQRTPLPTGQNIQAIGYVQGQFVALAGAGGVLASPDGVKWTSRPMSPTGSPIYSVGGFVYGAGQYVAVGGGGAVLTSPDGVEWTPQWSGLNASLLSIAYGNNRFVAVGRAGDTGRAIISSDDGTRWTVERLSNEASLSQVLFAGGWFVAVGDAGTILTSPDGISWWNARTPGGAALTGTAYGNKRYVAVSSRGQCLTSTDGLAWTTNRLVLQSSRPSIAFGGGQFLILDSSWVWLSADGLNWTPEEADFLSQAYALCYGAGRFVAVGSLGFVATSGDGRSWQQQSSGQDVLFGQVVAGNGVFLATGYTTAPVALKTRDGAGWAPAGLDANYQPDSVAFAGDQFIVFARDRRNPAPGFVLTSPDGADWTRTDLNSTGGALSVLYANGLYLAVGGGVFTSRDGQHWTVQPAVSANSLVSVAHGNGRYVAIPSDTGQVFLSGTGTNWVMRETGTNWLAAVTFGHGQFVGIGYGVVEFGGPGGPGGRVVMKWGEILTSVDGEQWTLQASPAADNGLALNSITYGGGWFVAVGQGGAIVTSPDGVHWTLRDPVTRVGLASVAYADGAFLAVGAQGLTLVSGNVLASSLDAPMLSPAGVSFTLHGAPGQTYRVQAASALDASSWVTIAAVTNQTGSVLVSDPSAGRSGSRFYRAVTP